MHEQRQGTNNYEKPEPEQGDAPEARERDLPDYLGRQRTRKRYAARDDRL